MPPNGWSSSQLGNILDVRHGFAFDSAAFNTDGVGKKLLTPANFAEGGGLRDLGRRQKYYSGEYPPEYLLSHGELTVVMTEQAPGLIGSSALVPNNAEFLHNQRLGLIRILDEEATSKRFVYHLFNSIDVRKQLAVSAAGTKVRHSSPDRIKKVKCLIPPRAEQDKIAAILDRVDGRIDITSRLTAAKRRLKRGLMQTLLSGRRRFPEFAGTPWQDVRIGDALQEAFRPVTWDDSALYRLASVRRASRGLFWREPLNGHQIKVKKLHTIRTGDFLLSHIQAAYGAMALVPAEFDGGHVSEMYMILTPRDPSAFDVRFFGYLAERPEMRHAAYVSSNGFFAERLRLNFDPNDFLRRRIHVPPTIAEQRRIADVLAVADHEIGLLEQQLTALRGQKKGLMQKLLTGQLRVPVDEKGAR